MWLFNLFCLLDHLCYTHPNRIPGYASGCSLAKKHGRGDLFLFRDMPCTVTQQLTKKPDKLHSIPARTKVEIPLHNRLDINSLFFSKTLKASKKDCSTDIFEGPVKISGTEDI